MKLHGIDRVNQQCIMLILTNRESVLFSVCVCVCVQLFEKNSKKTVENIQRLTESFVKCLQKKQRVAFRQTGCFRVDFFLLLWFLFVLFFFLFHFVCYAKCDL